MVGGLTIDSWMMPSGLATAVGWLFLLASEAGVSFPTVSDASARRERPVMISKGVLQVDETNR
jgi:hypothetical protein